MDSLLSSSKRMLTDTSDALTPVSLLECGLCSAREGRWIEAIYFFKLAREQLLLDQAHVAAEIDAFLLSHACYWETQQTLHLASRRFVEAETLQKTRLCALEKLLSTLKGASDQQQSSPPAISLTPVPPHQPPPLAGPATSNAYNYQPSQSTLKQDDVLPALSVTCFGRFEVKRFGQSIVLCPNQSGQAILRYLIAQPAYRASKDTLMGVLWPETPLEGARRKLQVAVSAIRCVLNSGYSSGSGGGYILYKDSCYLLNPSVQISTDVDEFLSLWKAAQQADGSKAILLYEQACSLYTDPFLVEDLYAPWSFIRREDLSQVYFSMCQRLANHYVERGCTEAAIKWLKAILKENRCDEEAHRQLIRIYAIQGRRNEALRQYHLCESLLARDFGAQPMPETVNLLRTLLLCEKLPTNETKIERE